MKGTDEKKTERQGTTSKGTEFCIVRFACNLSSMSKLFDVVQYFNGEGNEIPTPCFTIKFFTYNGDETSQEWPSEMIEGGEKVIDSSEQAFFKAVKLRKLIIWEPIFPRAEGTDVEYIQYFLLVLNSMEQKGYRSRVRISAGVDTDSHEYIPVEYGEAGARLRTFLYLYPDEKLSKIRIYSKYNEDIKWQAIKGKNAADLEPFGRLFPLITITPEVYQALVQTTCEKAFLFDNDDQSEQFLELYKNYIRRFLQNKYKRTVNRSDVRKSGLTDFKNDSLLEGLIFIATLTYLEEYELTDRPRKKELARLHEICVDYAHGIAQLLENIIFHVISRDTETKIASGCGSFTFRIRKTEDAKYYKAKEDDKDPPKYFMELYVTDLNYGAFDGFVNKFIQNAERRKYYFQEVRLPYLFGEELEKSKPMREYYENGCNIALHYGLQILNSTVMTGGGGFYVSSGSVKDTKPTVENTFFNEPKADRHIKPDFNESEAGRYVKPDFLWRNGTAYIIYLPVKYQRSVSYADSISVPDLEDNKEHGQGKPLNLNEDSLKALNRSALTPEGKANAVKMIYQTLADGVNEKDAYYYIDLSGISSNFIYAYEVLSKAIFLLLCGVEPEGENAKKTEGEGYNPKQITNIALIGIRQEYDVIKVFRQFALFYNRFGKNEKMGNKSVYLIDTEGKLDLLLYGSRLDSIRNNLSYNQIYGGYSDEAMEIITHLCKETDANGSGENGENGEK